MSGIANKCISILLITGILVPWRAIFAQTLATGFDPAFIISDVEMLDYNSLNQDDIQKFLDSKEGALKTLRIEDMDGQVKLASGIINRVAQENRINPKILLVMLQKEQSLILDANPSNDQLNWATGYGICDACSKDDPRLQKYKGFATQLDYLAGALRFYFDNPNQFRFRVGSQFNIDNTKISPLNQATVNLYIYTPHIEGNQNFWKLWNKWFARLHPDGTLLQVAGEPGVWLVERGQRRPIQSKSALTSRFDSKKIIKITASDLQRYNVGRPIRYAQYALIRTPDNDIMLLMEDTLRKFESDTVVKEFGFTPDEIKDVDWADIEHYTIGDPITLGAVYPLGILLQEVKTGGIFYVQDGVKHPIWSKEILANRFGKKKVRKDTKNELKKYTAGDPVPFSDGTLVKAAGSSVIYVISNGERKPIASETTFASLGYKMTNVIETSARSLKVHELGEAIK